MLPSKTKNLEKLHQNCAQKVEFILVLAPLGAPLAAKTAFDHQKWVPSAPEVLPMIEK